MDAARRCLGWWFLFYSLKPQHRGQTRGITAPEEVEGKTLLMREFVARSSLHQRREPEYSAKSCRRNRSLRRGTRAAVPSCPVPKRPKSPPPRTEKQPLAALCLDRSSPKFYAKTFLVQVTLPALRCAVLETARSAAFDAPITLAVAFLRASLKNLNSCEFAVPRPELVAVRD